MIKNNRFANSEEYQIDSGESENHRHESLETISKAPEDVRTTIFGLLVKAKVNKIMANTIIAILRAPGPKNLKKGRNLSVIVS